MSLSRKMVEPMQRQAQNGCETKRLRKPNHLQARCGPRGLPKARADPQRAGGLVWPTHKPATTLDHSPLDPSPGYTGITLYLSLSDASPLCLTSAAFAARAFRGPRAAACIAFLLAGCGWGWSWSHHTDRPHPNPKKKCRGAHGSIRNRLPHPPDRSRTVQPPRPSESTSRNHSHSPPTRPLLPIRNGWGGRGWSWANHTDRLPTHNVWPPPPSQQSPHRKGIGRRGGHMPECVGVRKPNYP